MREDFAGALRNAASSALPPGAFLRRDRGDALFVTDAPRRAADGGWLAELGARGFDCRVEDGLARLTPGPAWAARLEALFPAPPDFLSASLARFGGPPDGEAPGLFAEGLRALDGGPGFERYDRRLRQCAARRLRDGGLTGGGLYACALVRYLIESERKT